VNKTAAATMVTAEDVAYKFGIMVQYVRDVAVDEAQDKGDVMILRLRNGQEFEITVREMAEPA
jgi:hypothetical protein